MAAPDSILQSVQTYQKSGLDYLMNQNCAIYLANKKWKNFETLPAQLGDTVLYDAPVRYSSAASLVADFQGTQQLTHSLTVDKERSVAFSFTDQNFIFNAEGYMDQFHASATHELSARIETDVWASTITNSPFRAYYSGITTGGGTSAVNDINSRTQLAQAFANFRNFGCADGNLQCVLPDMAVPPIIGSDLSRFTPILNDEEVNSWQLGNFSRADMYQSNLLPLHQSGTVGDTGTVMTVVSISDDGSQIVFSGAGNAQTINKGDILVFNDGVSGHANLRYLTYVGHQPSAQKVQCLVTAGVTSSSGGAVTVDISWPLISDLTSAQANINTPVVAGMQAIIVPSHRAGVIISGKAFYLAMPQLPDEDPFKTAYAMDKDTGCSLRVYYGSKFAQNERGYVTDAIWGSSMVDLYTMRLCFPVNV